LGREWQARGAGDVLVWGPLAGREGKNILRKARGPVTHACGFMARCRPVYRVSPDGNYPKELRRAVAREWPSGVREGLLGAAYWSGASILAMQLGRRLARHEVQHPPGHRFNIGHDNGDSAPISSPSPVSLGGLTRIYSALRVGTATFTCKYPSSRRLVFSARNMVCPPSVASL
jgi:hypothetical protein